MNPAIKNNLIINSKAKPSGLVNAIILLGLLICLPCQAGDLSLSMDQALSLFYKRNLDLIAAQYNIDQARAQEIIAGAIPNPTLSFDVEQIAPQNKVNPGKNPITEGGAYFNILIQQLIQTAGKRGLGMESSRLGTEASEEDLQDALRTLTNAVRKAYYSLLLAQKNAEVAEDNTSRYQQLWEVNRLRLKQGDISEADFLRIEVEKLKAESDWNNATAAVKSAQTELAKLLSWPDNVMSFKAKDNWPDKMPLTEKPNEETLLEKALQQRPDIAAAKTRTEQAQKQLTLARRLAIPDVTVGVGYSHDPQNINSDFAQVQVSVPIPLFYQKQGEVSQAAVNLQNAQLNLAQTEQTLRADVVSSLAKWQAAEKVVNRYKKDILTKIDQIRESAELSYLNGATGLIDLVEAERVHKSALLDYYTALNNRSLTYADLQMAVGDK